MFLIHLNFNWFFKNDFQDLYINDYLNTSDFEKVNLPHTSLELPYNYLNEPPFNFLSTYKKEIMIENDYQGKILRLTFEGVAHKSDIYINGKKVLTHLGGYDEFFVDIENFVNYNETNILSVVVDSSENKDIPPFGNVVDYLGYGGIYREVYLKVLEKEHIENCFLSSVNFNKGLKVETKLTVNRGVLEIEISNQEKQVNLSNFLIHNYQESFTINLKDIKIWDLDNPNLYDVKVRLIIYGKVKDEFSSKFGFREIKFTKSGFYLNQKLIKLRGLNRHQSYPYVGYAMPKSAQEKDAEILKFDLGVNIVRSSHYLASKHFLNRCDEIGLLVFEEIPGWQHIGDETFKEVSYNNVRSMIKRDYNHPAIIMWGVRINESADNEEFYKETNRIAKDLDQTRPTGGVRNFAKSQMFEDVYTFNDFTNSGGKKVLNNPSKVKKNVPYLVTEFNGHMYPTKAFDDEAHRVEQAIRHYRILEAAFEYRRLSGTIGWCMNDYNTHQQFGSGDKICYHGVLDMFRNFKYAAFIYACQQDKKPVLEVLSTLNYGDYSAGYMKEVNIATNCDYVKIFKNNQLIDTVYPKKGKLKHPLIKITDLIGSELEEKEGFSKKDAIRTKKLFLEINKFGYNLPIKSKLIMLYILLKYRIKFKDAGNLYFKYVGGINSYRFEGYKDNELIKTIVKENVQKTNVLLEADKDLLEEDTTYDVTRITVKKTDQNFNLLPYADDALTVKTKGGISLIGPDLLSLKGGMISFWVKTNQSKEHGELEVIINGQTLTKTFVIK